ncbi:MAG: hypothetical protein ABI402_14375 [Ferruginibacter sp.]
MQANDKYFNWLPYCNRSGSSNNKGSFNPDFAVENLLGLPKAAQLSISEHFLISK